jgi:uncharacterized protein (TIGR02231 family)
MMVKKLLAVVLLIAGITVAKADDGSKIASKVQKVTVFLNGAQVTRTAQVNIGAGTTALVFGDVSPTLEPQSIQVHANGDFTILAVKQDLHHLNEDGKSKQVEDLQALQKIVKGKIDLQNSLLIIYQSEEATLMKNQFVKAENASLDVLKLKEALDFQTERLTSIKQKELAINSQLEALAIEYQKYTTQINEINDKRNASICNIVVTVSSKMVLQTTFSLSYIIHSASWYPTYDIKAKNVNSPITIVYKANVAQTSGEEWKNIKLTLSTGNPSLSGMTPVLRPYFINDVASYLQGRAAGVSLSEVVVTGYATDKRQTMDEPASITVNTLENQTNVEFSIENPYTVQSDGKVCVAEINQVEVNATYQYYAAPKMNTNVFLTAKVTDWNKYNFLSGEANLFFEGTYLGKSKIDTHLLSDTLNLSLGVDKGIIVKRILKQDLSERQSLGSNKKETKDWLIEIKNRKNQPIDLLVEDQVPVSQNTAIEVETQELSGGKVDAITGKVAWSLNLKPQEEKKLEIKYQVKYPKNQTVIVQ